MLTCPCNVYPLTPHFYIAKVGFTGVYIFLIFALKHRLWVLVRTASLCFEQKYKNFHLKNYHSYRREILQYIARTCLRNVTISDR